VYIGAVPPSPSRGRLFSALLEGKGDARVRVEKAGGYAITLETGKSVKSKRHDEAIGSEKKNRDAVQWGSFCLPGRPIARHGPGGGRRGGSRVSLSPRSLNEGKGK